MAFKSAKALTILEDDNDFVIMDITNEDPTSEFFQFAQRNCEKNLTLYDGNGIFLVLISLKVIINKLI